MIRILFLAATPVDQAHLRVRQEFDELRRALDSAEHGRRFELIQEFAAAADQLQALLFRHRPQIVHFSGHGTAGGLVFEGADGSSHLVAPQTLRDLFANFKQQVRCVVLNACYSETQATAIATVIDSVVGMGDALTDDAALAFAVAFHRALANGTTLADAVALGRNQLDLQNLDEAHKPQLLAERIDPHRVHALDWDDSPSADDQEAIVFIPFLRKSATEFVGRDAELVELHEKLQQSQMVGVRPAAALTGLGGIGKTQLAVEYAYRYGVSYPGGIFWINAADLNRVRSGLVETAERMALRTDYTTTDNALLAALVKRCQQQPATLLCFDNAPDAVILWRRLTQELNTATLGATILITTRRRELPTNMAALDLRRLSDNTVRQLLGTARPDLLTDPDLPRLLERLGGVPLVVSLVANALHNSPDATIADYLAALAQHGEETVHEALDVHVADYDLYREVYTRTLLPVLREQWERLCQQPKSENAQLLLRIAGQLPEAAEIPIARLGLLAGLQDEKVIKPLKSAIDTLWKLALIEELKEEAIRLHPLARDFAAGLTPTDECAAFRTACAQRLADAYTFEEVGLRRLGSEYTKRGITALLIDMISALDLTNSSADPLPQFSNAAQEQSPIRSLELLLRLLRREAQHLQGKAQDWRPERLWQQLLLRASLTSNSGLIQRLTAILRQTLHWLLYWSYQSHLIESEQTLSGHEFGVLDVAVLDASHIVSASVDGTLKVWNLATSAVEQTLAGHEDPVNAVTVLDTNCIVSASSDNTLKVWNLATGAVKQTLIGHEHHVLDVAKLDTNRIVSASGDNTLKVWNLATGAVEQTLTGHKDSVRAVAVLDHNLIVSASNDNTLKVWNLVTGAAEQTLMGHKDHINDVTVLDANRIVSASSDNTLKVWNLATGAVEQTFIGAKFFNAFFAVEILDTNRIVSASSDNTLKVWNLATGAVEQTLMKHDDSVFAVAVLDSNLIVSASEDHTLAVWNIATGRLDQTPTDYEGSINAVAILDANHLVSVSNEDTLKVWDIVNSESQEIFIGPSHFIQVMAVFNPQQIIFGGRENRVSVWNLGTDKVTHTPTRNKNIGHGSIIGIVDQNRVVSNWQDHSLKLWNLNTGTIEQTLLGYEVQPGCIAKLDTQRIIFVSNDERLKIWNLATNVVEQMHTGDGSWGFQDSVNAVALFDNTRVVSASSDRTLKVWDLVIGQVIASIGLDRAPQCVAVTRQGGRTFVVAGDAGGSLYCLELVEPVAS